MYVHTYVWYLLYIRTYVHAYIRTHIRMYICTYVHCTVVEIASDFNGTIYLLIKYCIARTFENTYVGQSFLQVLLHLCARACVCVCVHTYVGTYVRMIDHICVLLGKWKNIDCYF